MGGLRSGACLNAYAHESPSPSPPHGLSPAKDGRHPDQPWGPCPLSRTLSTSSRTAALRHFIAALRRNGRPDRVRHPFDHDRSQGSHEAATATLICCVTSAIRSGVVAAASCVSWVRRSLVRGHTSQANTIGTRSHGQNAAFERPSRLSPRRSDRPREERRHASLRLWVDLQLGTDPLPRLLACDDGLLKLHRLCALLGTPALRGSRGVARQSGW